MSHLIQSAVGGCEGVKASRMVKGSGENPQVGMEGTSSADNVPWDGGTFQTCRHLIFAYVVHLMAYQTRLLGSIILYATGSPSRSSILGAPEGAPGPSPLPAIRSPWRVRPLGLGGPRSASNVRPQRYHPRLRSGLDRQGAFNWVPFNWVLGGPC